MKKEYFNPTMQLHELRHRSQILEVSPSATLQSVKEFNRGSNADGIDLDSEGFDDAAVIR